MQCASGILHADVVSILLTRPNQLIPMLLPLYNARQLKEVDVPRKVDDLVDVWHDGGWWETQIISTEGKEATVRMWGEVDEVSP